jgi:hypothetical protein
MSDTTISNDVPGGAEEREGWNWVELTAAILLGIAGILTAFAAYKGSLADGNALQGYTKSSRTTADANGFYNDYSSTYNADKALFTQYQLQVELGNQDIADVIKANMFSIELEAATDEWLQIPADTDGAPATPLDADFYTIEALDEATALYEQAEAEFAEASEIDDQGDNFDLAGVFFAISLFFAGIAALFKVRSLQVAMLIGSILMLLPGLWAISQGQGWI